MSHLIDYSQYGQPAFLRKLIPEDAPKWVVDVGAHDGIDGSNSRGFILEDWTGLLIEPLPSVFEHLRENTAGMKNVLLERCACSEFEGEATFHIGKDGPDGQLSSLCEDEVWKQYWGGQEIKVRVRRLQDLLNKHNCPPDFALLLVDAEGMDLEVLRSLDFSQFRPAVICTEIYALNPAKDKLKAEFLELSGYRLRGRVGFDMIWCRADLEVDSTADMFSDKNLYNGTQLPPDVTALSANIGSMAVDRASATDGLLTVSGWAFSSEQTTPEIVFVGVKTKNGMKWQQSCRCVRSDVARHFGNQGLLFSGFRACFPDPAESPVEVTVVQVQGSSRWDAASSVPRTEGF